MVSQYEYLGKVAVTDDDPERTRALVRELRDEGYEYAITNTAATGGVLPILKDTGFRVVSLIHELPGIIDEYDLHASLESIVDESDAIVVAAESVAEAVKASASPMADKIVIRPQGLYQEVESFSEARAVVRRKLGIPQHARIVLNVGSGDFRKGVDIFLHAAKLTSRETPDLHFVWVGKLNDDAARWLQADLRGALQDRVHLVSYTDEVAPYFAAADVFFLTSREDPYPSVVLEAMRVGLPVVALRDSGGIEKLVGAYGTVVDRNDMGEIVTALCTRAAEEDQTARERRRRLIRECFRFDEYCFDLLRLLDPALDKVSVLIPNFNYRGYLRDRLAGVFAQSYPLFEVIVLDDGSEDGSLDELERISDETGRRFQIVPNERNSGSTFRQWAKACRLARGDLVWIAEADDLTRPEFLERVVRKLGYGDVAYAFSDSAQIDERGQLLGDTYKDYYRTSAGSLMERDFVIDGESFVRHCLVERNLILNVSSVVWTRSSLIEALDRCLDDVAECRVAGDWYLYAAAALAGRQVAYLAEPLNIHRRHASSVTGSLEKRRHLEEVQHVHSAIARWLNADAGIRARMESYEAELARLFGLTHWKRTNGDYDAVRHVRAGDATRRQSPDASRNGDQVA